MFNYLTTNDFKLNVIDAEDPEVKSIPYLPKISVQNLPTNYDYFHTGVRLQHAAGSVAAGGRGEGVFTGNGGSTT